MPELQLLRPWWLAALPLLLGVLWWVWRSGVAAGRWRRVCDPHLLGELLVPRDGGGQRRWLVAGAVAVVLAVLALTGPVVRKGESALMSGGSGRVVVLDLSPSMHAVDLIPSRLHRARQAIVEVLRRGGADRHALVVFAGDAFVVAPMTRDLQTLEHLLSALEPGLMPRAGARPDLGFEAAGSLLEAAGVGAGDVLYVGDSAGDGRSLEVARDLDRRGFPLSVLAAGTAAGGPIRQPSGALVTDPSGQVVVAALAVDDMARIARAGGGRLVHLGLEGGDLSAVLSGPGSLDAGKPAVTRGVGRARDDGPWLLLLLLPVAAMAFRRGWLLAVILCLQPLASRPVQALDWDALWLRPDQRVARALEHGASEQAWLLAEGLTIEPRWRAAAAYRAGEFEAAVRIYSGLQGARAHYNLGNALVARGRLHAALRAYEQALRLTPREPDALFNWKLVSRALGAAREGQRTARARPDGGSGPSARGGRVGRPGTGAGRPARAARETATTASGRQGKEGGSAAVAPRGSTPRGDPDPGELDERQRQRLERLLARLPGSPAGLLRRRFAMQLARRAERETDTGPAW